MAALEGEEPALDRFVGIYDSIWGQSAIVRWKDGLAELWLKSRDPKEALTPLEKTTTGEWIFTRVREWRSGRHAFAEEEVEEHNGVAQRDDTIVVHVGGILAEDGA